MTGTVNRRAHIGLLSVTVVLNGTISVITIPLIVAIAGAAHWASMVTGQSIGGSFAVLVIFGWGLTGPVTVAMSAPAARPALFLDSLVARGGLLVPVLIVQTLVTFAIVPHEKVVAVVAGAAMTLAGASANWFFVGESRAGRFLALDTVPRVVGTLTGALLLVATGQLLLFALAQLAGSIAAIALSSFVIMRGHSLDYRGALRWRRVLRSLREQRHGVVATGLVAAWTPAMLAIIALFSPTLLPAFALADRIAKFAAMAISPLFQMLQGWVPSAAGRELVRRIRLAGTITAVASLLAGTVYTILLPWFSALLAHGQVEYLPLEAIAFGLLATLQLSTPYVTQVALMAVGRLQLIARSVMIGVPASLLLLAAVELLRAPELGVWTVVVTSAAVMAWQVLALRRTLANWPAGATSEAGAETRSPSAQLAPVAP